MHTFTFPVQKVKAALIFAAKSDIRYYLNGVYFVRRGNDMLAVATDGHRLTVLREGRALEGNNAAMMPIPREFAVIVDRDQLAQAIKAHGTAALDLIFQVNPPAEKGSTARKVRILANGGGSVFEAKEIEGKFPAWEAVIPREFGPIEVREHGGEDAKVEPYACLDASYLADYAKAAKALGLQFTGISFAQGKNSASFVVNLQGAPDFISVLMSMRGDAPTRPDWLDEPKAEELREAA